MPVKQACPCITYNIYGPILTLCWWRDGVTTRTCHSLVGAKFWTRQRTRMSESDCKLKKTNAPYLYVRKKREIKKHELDKTHIQCLLNKVRRCTRFKPWFTMEISLWKFSKKSVLPHSLCENLTHISFKCLPVPQIYGNWRQLVQNKSITTKRQSLFSILDAGEMPHSGILMGHFYVSIQKKNGKSFKLIFLFTCHSREENSRFCYPLPFATIPLLIFANYINYKVHFKISMKYALCSNVVASSLFQLTL